MSQTVAHLDLTQRPPRSPRIRLGGYVLLPRILDKGRASLAGKLGEYHYSGKGLDRHFFNYVGLDYQALTAELGKGLSDYDMLQWVQANAKNQRQPWEILAWSEYQLKRGPDSDVETMGEYVERIKKFNPLREDIITWFDYVDVDDFVSFGGKA